MKPVSAWGRLSNDLHDVQVMTDRTQVADMMAVHQPGLAYGNGRSYGDVCLNPLGTLWHTCCRQDWCFAWTWLRAWRLRACV